MSTTIDGVINLRENADFLVLEDMPQSFTISADIAVSRKGALFTINTSDSSTTGVMEIYITELGPTVVLGWLSRNLIGGYDHVSIPFIYGNFNLKFSYEQSGVARIYINGALVKTHQFTVVPATLVDLHFGKSGEAVYTANCYIDEFIVYDYAFTEDLIEETLIADFEANITKGGAPLNVQFADLSTSESGIIVDWKWTFGDGGTSTESNPQYTYEEEGQYHVSLTVTDSDNQTATETKQFYIIIAGTITDLTAEFEADVIQGAPPLTVNFTDASQGPNDIIHWQWNFDVDSGSTVDSTLQNASHTYTEEGVYSVSLKVIDSTFDYDTEFKGQYIIVQEDQNEPPVADFTDGFRWVYGQDEEITYTMCNFVRFFDKSTNMSANQSSRTWLWDFGDETTSTEQNPYHFYSSTGTYNVSLTVTNAYGSDSITKTGYIVVTTAGCTPPTPYFQVDNTTPDINEVITFHDLSSGCPTDWTWNFGDGQTSTVQHATHSYTSAGVYDVSLYLENECGSNRKEYVRCITVSDPTIDADFTSDVTTTDGVVVNFYDISIGQIDTYWWDFGDGSYSSEQNPQHRYPVNDTLYDQYYDVSLTITSGSYSNAEPKLAYITIEPTLFDDNYPDPPSPGTLFLKPRTGYAPLKVDVITDYLQSYISAGCSYRINWGEGGGWEAFSSSHNYRFYGNYTVTCEFVQNGVVVDAYENIINVYSTETDTEPDGYPEPPLAGTLFLTPRAGSAPLQVSLLMTHITPYIERGYSYRVLWEDSDTQWDTSSSNHVYIPGVYRVRIEFYKGNVTEARWENVITVNNYVDQFINFVAPLEGDGPLTCYILADVITTLKADGGWTNYKVNWGDSSDWEESSTSHEFSAWYDRYTVTLKMYNSTGYQEYENHVTVNDIRPRYDFIADQTYFSDVPATVTFTNLSLYERDDTEWAWYYGNNFTTHGASVLTLFSTDKNPDPITLYGSLQTYDIVLYCSDSYYYDQYIPDFKYTIFKQDYITTGGLHVQLFIWEDTDHDTPTVRAYIDAPVYLTCDIYSNTPITSVTWNFGDGTSGTSTATLIETPHHYTASTTHTYTRCSSQANIKYGEHRIPIPDGFTPSVTVVNEEQVSLTSSAYNIGKSFPYKLLMGCCCYECWPINITVYEITPGRYLARLIQHFDNKTGSANSDVILLNLANWDRIVSSRYVNSMYSAFCKYFNNNLTPVFSESDGYALIINPFAAVDPTYYRDEYPLSTYMPKAFSVIIDFTCTDTVGTGTLVSCGNASINLHGPFSYRESTDTSVRITFNNTVPVIPYTENTEFVLTPYTTYRVVLISQNVDYYHGEVQSERPSCPRYTTTKFHDVPQEIRAYIIVNGHWYLLGRFYESTGPVYLGQSPITDTLPAATDVYISNIYTYNYPYDKDYPYDYFEMISVPITNYKETQPGIYWNYIVDDFPAYDSDWFTDNKVVVDVLSGAPILTVTIKQDMLNYSLFGDIYYVNWGDDIEWEQFGKSHAYIEDGSYTLTVKIYEVVYGETAVKTLTKTYTNIITVSSTYDTPKCNFSAESSINDGVTWTDDLYVDVLEDTPVQVKFTNTSITNPEDGVVTYLWSFGDGTYSTDEDPTHTYTESGSYNVSLQIHLSRNDINLSHIEDNYISIIYYDSEHMPIELVQPDFMMCSYYWDDDYGYISGPYSYGTILSIYPDTFTTTMGFKPLNVPASYVSSYLWEFGDDDTSSERFPMHDYDSHGITKWCYSPKLTVTLVNGDVKSKQRYDSICLQETYDCDDPGQILIKISTDGGRTWVENTTAYTYPVMARIYVRRFCAPDPSDGDLDYEAFYGDGTKSSSKDVIGSGYGHGITLQHTYSSYGEFTVTVNTYCTSRYTSLQDPCRNLDLSPISKTIHIIDPNSSDATDEYTMGSMMYATTSTYLPNLPITGSISDSDFSALMINEDPTLQTATWAVQDLTASYEFTFTNTALANGEHYLIFVIDTDLESSTERIVDATGFNIMPSLIKSYILRNITGIQMNVRTYITRYPVASLNGNYTFTYYRR